MALIEASLEELPVRAELGQSCSATKISAPGPSSLGGSTTIRTWGEQADGELRRVMVKPSLRKYAILSVAVRQVGYLP